MARRIAIQVLLAAVLAVRLAGQETTGAPAAPPPLEQVKALLQSIDEELAAARGRLEALAPETPVETRRSSQGEVDKLGTLKRLVSQRLTILQQLEDRESEIQRLTPELEILRARGPTAPRPWSFLDLDQARQDLESNRSKTEALEEAVSSGRKALELARGEKADGEREARLVRERADRNPTPALAMDLRLATLTVRVLEETFRIRQRELALAESTLALSTLRKTASEVVVQWYEKETRFSESDLQQILAELRQQESSLQRPRDDVTFQLNYAAESLVSARRRLDEAGLSADIVLTEEVAARQRERQAHQVDLILIDDELQRLAESRVLWQRRYDLSSDSMKRDELATWIDESRQAITGLEVRIQTHEGPLAELRRDEQAIQGKLREGDPAKKWIDAQLKWIRHLISRRVAAVADLENLRGLHLRFLVDADAGSTGLALGEQLANIWRIVTNVWQYELVSFDENPIYVGKIIIGILLLVMGLSASRWLSALLGRLLLPRLRLGEGVAPALQSVLFYTLLLTFVLFALKVVNIPLTVFTVLGGAFAIGFGFGSQNIVKNFISGLILLAERPVRVGDLIQVGDLYGAVEHIGARSTRVRTGDNMEILVPNSSFLESNVINWTLSDKAVRVKVVVGVAYGSPTREVQRLLRFAVDEHGLIHKKPAPITLFSEFGDNSLGFEVHFWIHIRSLMDRRIIESDIRYRIDHLFREAGITIAFPQRDVHLDTLRPLEVRVVPPSDGATSAVTDSSPTAQTYP